MSASLNVRAMRFGSNNQAWTRSLNSDIDFSACSADSPSTMATPVIAAIVPIRAARFRNKRREG